MSSRLSISQRSCASMLSALAAFTMAAPDIAMADQYDSLNFSLGAALRYDDNLFRLSDSISPQLAIGNSNKSDRILTTNAGIKINKLYAQQIFQINATLLDNSYNTFSYLDYKAFNYSVAWLWHLTPYVSGVASTDQQQVLNNFADFRGLNNQINRTQSIQTTNKRLFNIDGLIGGGIHLLGGVSEFTSSNSQNFDAVGNYTQDGFEFGIKYVAPSENSISLIHRESKGDFGRTANPFNQLDSGFKQSETEAQLNMRLSGKSAIVGRLGYLDRKHDNFSSRDFDGINGSISYNWQPTGKITVNSSLTRSYSSYQQFINSYYISDTFSVGPIWQTTAKTSVRLRYDYSNRNYFGSLIPLPELRKEDVQLFLIEADWNPTRTIQVSGVLQHEDRKSNSNNFNGLGGDINYNANSATISAQLLF